MKSRSLLWLSVCIALSACSSTPVIKYKLLGSGDDPASPPANSFVFAARSSIAMLVPATPLKGADQDPLAPIDVCATNPTRPATATQAAAAPMATSTPAKNKHGKQPHEKKDLAPTLIASSPTLTWVDCVNRMAAAVAPTRKGQGIYIGTSGYGTTVNTAPGDADPLLLKSIAVNYKNPAPGLIASAGTNAAAGLAVAGPWGAVAGALVTLAPADWSIWNTATPAAYLSVHSIGGKGTAPVNQPGEQLKKLICSDAIAEVASSDYNAIIGKSPTLTLPIAIADPVPKPEIATKGCWRPLALNASLVVSQSPEWFFRVVDADPADEVGGLRADDQFPQAVTTSHSPPVGIVESTGKTLDQIVTDGKSFPITACHVVKLQVTWWKALDVPDPVAGPKPDTLSKSFTIKVADPGYVQVVRLASGGTINVGSICGGYAVYSPPSTIGSDLAAASFNAAAGMLKAQADRDKAAKK